MSTIILYNKKEAKIEHHDEVKEVKNKNKKLGQKRLRVKVERAQSHQHTKHTMENRRT